MSSPPPDRPRPLPVARLVLVGFALGVVAVLALRDVELAAVRDGFIAAIREAGPWVFFSALAVLPAIGAPVLAFTIPAGEAFAGRFGMSVVVVIAMAMMTINLALAYWLARYGFRPLLTALIKRYGYRIPRVTPENALNVALLVRFTPGPPYFLQCFVLGVAEMPFRLYMIVSWVALLPWVVGAILLGRGLFGGHFRAAAAGAGVLIAATVLVRWLLKRAKSREA